MKPHPNARTRKLIQPKFALLILAYIAFIALGMPDGLLGVAWPSMRAGFNQPLDSLGLLLLASTSGYLTSSFFSGRLVSRLGVGRLVLVCFSLTGVSLLGYTFVPSWWLLLPLGVTAGLGVGAIDAGLNTYLASNHGEGPMQWLHACFGIGITLGPLLMTYGLSQFGSWRFGYRMVAIVQIMVALGFGLSARLWGRASARSAAAPKLTDYQTPLASTLRRVETWASILLFFLYTGLELSLGHWTYTLLTESRGVDPQMAGLWAGSYWGMFTLGRVVAGIIAGRVGAARLVRASLLLALAGTVLVWWDPLPLASLIGVGLTGFAIAPVFPALVSGTEARVGARHAANTIGIQISAAGLGAALLPGFTGVLARRVGLEAIPVFWVVVCLLLFLGVLLANRNNKHKKG